MSKNSRLTGAGGNIFAADNITVGDNEVYYQKVKIVLGGDGTDEGTLSSSDGIPITSPAATITDISDTITLGGTAQVLSAANASRKGYRIQNQSANALYISTTGTATVSSASFKIDAGAYFESMINGCPLTAISIIGPVTGQAFFAEEW